MFLDGIGGEVEWQFGVELTLKAKRRCSQGVFPKCIEHLKNYKDICLIYITPSSIIKEELDMPEGYFIDKEEDEYEKVFDGLRVFSAEKFKSEPKRLLEEDESISWEGISGGE